MPTTLQFRRGTNAQNNSFTGAAGEITFDTTNKTLRVHDASTAGGTRLATKAELDAIGTPTTVSGNAGTATALQNARTISGVSFDGTANITLNTSAITENTNLYFTNARADARISNALLDEDNMASNSATKIPSQQSVKAYVDAQVATKDNTDEIAEGSSNLYYTNARVDTRIGATSLASLANVHNATPSDGQVLKWDNSNSRWAPAADGGGTVTEAFKTISVSGQDNVVADGATDTLTLVAGSNMTITTNASGDTITFASSGGGGGGGGGGDITSVVAGTGLSGGGTTGDVTLNATDASTSAKGIASFSSDHFAVSSGAVTLKADGIDDTHIDFGTGTNQVNTDDLPEGSTNLYYTNARADARITAALIDEDNMSSNSATRLPSQQSVKAYVDAQVATKDNTDEITEGSSNLYFTNARADARITNALLDEDNMASNSATKVASQQSIKAYVDAQVATKDNTDEITEGSSNLYFTNARADARITNALKDEDNMASNSATHVPSQQSVKAYVDAQTLSLIDEDNMSTNSATRPPSQQSVKAYVDNVASGLDVKKSVRIATTAAGTLSSSFANGQTVDGVSLSTGDRILIKDQSTGSENGIYTVNSSGAPTRATDFDANSEVTAGAFTFVEEGTANADTGWVLSTNGSITLGSTALAFTQFSGAGLITAGNALTKSGNTMHVAVDDATVEINSDALRIKADGINDTHIDWGTGTNQVSTADIPENTNLYYTNARADARITAALIDEDNMSSNSATRLPSQQSVKAYVDAQVATKDNTDEITEGSSNLYFTNARADARITNALLDEDNMSSNSATKVASQQSIKAYVDAQTLSLIDEDNMSTNSATRPPSQQSVKAYVDGQTTDETAEGSTNLYYTNARVDARLAGAAQTINGNGSSGGVTISDGSVVIRNGGTASKIDLYCESSNSHYTRVQSTAHANYSGNVTLTLPAASGTLARTADIPTLGGNYVDSAGVNTLANARIAASAISALSNVHTASPSNDQVLAWDSDNSRWAPANQSGGGSSLTVQEEGSALSTAATTLNFVGSAVTATGSGATKTITITGGGGGVDSAAVNTLIGNATGTLQAINHFDFEADSAQTVFSGTDIDGNTLSYTSGAIQVFLNGILLTDSNDYTATNGTQIVLNSGADSGDVINISTFSKLSGGVKHFRYSADSAQTTFQGTDVLGQTLSYNAGSIEVFLNGILLVDSDDYTASNGTSVVLTSGADSDDVIQISDYKGAIHVTDAAITPIVDSAYVQARVSGGTDWQPVKTSNYTAVSGQGVFVNSTGGAKTVTLPASPVLGDEVRVIDAYGTAATNNITIARNSKKIMGADSDFIIDINRSAVGLVFVNDAQGWLQIER